MTTVLLLTSTPIIANAINGLLTAQFPGAMLKVAFSNKEAFEQIRKGGYNLFIIDSHLATTFFPTATKVPTLLLSDDAEQDVHLYQMGISGIFDKRHEMAELLLAIQEISRKNIYLSKELKNYLLHQGSATPKQKQTVKLSKRETEVFRMIIEGKKMSEIGHSLAVKPSTVSTFKSKLYRKLGVSNLIQLQQFANRYPSVGN